ncbi:MAG: 5-formyltetrahydrofolate cyclo-ligase [Maricaulaceae bacterium]
MSEKSALRATLKTLRAKLAAAEPDAGARLVARWPGVLQGVPGRVVAGYWPLGSEIDPRPLMAALADRGARLALPVVAAAQAPLVFRDWSPGTALEPGPNGTHHPPPSAAQVRPDWVLVPLLGFDSRGVRLGYGGGYYDRTLAALRSEGAVTAVGLAYAGQAVARAPY